MSMMPEDRADRWRSVFRRYGIPKGTDAPAEAQDAEPALNPLTQRAKESLLPEGLPRGKKKKSP